MSPVPHYVFKKLEKQRRQADRTPNRFVSWDGEGTTDHGYNLFGCSDYPPLIGKSLGTMDMLEYISDCAQTPNVINVSFGFTYDVDNILIDVPDDQLKTLLEDGKIVFGPFSIEWIPRKMFTVRKRGKGNKSITIYDTISFFQTNLISACKQYLGDDHHLIRKVEDGKGKRQTFLYSEMETIIKPYWEIEGELFIELMDSLRYAMKSAGLNLRHWHGPGAVAGVVFAREKMGLHIEQSRFEMPAEVTDATAFSFFGGRFESFQIGRIPGPIYSYDIRSAYPAAMATLHSVAKGKWRRTTEVVPEGIYQTALVSDPSDKHSPRPLPFRTDKGIVSFAAIGQGWHYGHEIIAARNAGFDVGISDGWVNDNNAQPFYFVRELYLQRAEWKRAGNPAQLAAKLAINSLYGKLAQLIGWDEKTGEPPKYHHQWYAGQITSWCRARIFEAMSQAPDAIIAVETDGIYSREPLNLTMSQHLGDWEGEIYDEAIYMQSGVYALRKGDEWIKSKARGFGKADVTPEMLASSEPLLEPITASVHRYGALTGHLGSGNHHKWYDQQRTMVWGGSGKREHLPDTCPLCITGIGTHRCSIAVPGVLHSAPRNIPWNLELAGLTPGEDEVPLELLRETRGTD